MLSPTFPKEQRKARKRRKRKKTAAAMKRAKLKISLKPLQDCGL